MTILYSDKLILELHISASASKGFCLNHDATVFLIFDLYELGPFASGMACTDNLVHQKHGCR